MRLPELIDEATLRAAYGLAPNQPHWIMVKSQSVEFAGIRRGFVLRDDALRLVGSAPPPAKPRPPKRRTELADAFADVLAERITATSDARRRGDLQRIARAFERLPPTEATSILAAAVARANAESASRGAEGQQPP